MARGLLATFALVVLAAAPAAGASPTSQIATAPEATGDARSFMVAAPNPLAVEAGLEVLRKGGNAIDAAVAVQMVLGFVESPETGIGGGGFLLYHDAASGRTTLFDGRETAPLAARPDRFRLLGQALPLWAAIPSGRAVGVPGLVAMLESAHRQHGTMTWAKLIEPAIGLADQGVPMPDRLQTQIAEDASLRVFSDMRGYFRRQAAEAPPRLTNRELADTLRAVARDGAAALYHGALAEALVDRVRTRRPLSGDMTMADLAGYRAVEREPVCGPYREWTVCGAPPPSSGGIAVLQILGMLERFPMADFGPDSAIALHLIAEASRLAFADRERYVGDPDFVDVPVRGLIDPAYLSARAMLIDEQSANPRALPGEPGRRALIREADANANTNYRAKTTGTSHLSIVDQQGNVVALTSSIEAPFGSRMMSGGFLLNNQLTDFSFDPLQDGRPHPNAVAPGKRPRSSMSPVMVFDADGELRLVLGARGGSRIIGHVVRTLVSVLDWELEVDHAIAMPNFVHRGEVLEIEAGSPLRRHRGALEQLGHTVTEATMVSGLHAIERTPEGWRGGADPRLDGTASGD